MTDKMHSIVYIYMYVYDVDYLKCSSKKNSSMRERAAGSFSSLRAMGISTEGVSIERE